MHVVTKTVFAMLTMCLTLHANATARFTLQASPWNFQLEDMNAADGVAPAMTENYAPNRWLGVKTATGMKDDGGYGTWAGSAMLDNMYGRGAVSATAAFGELAMELELPAAAIQRLQVGASAFAVLNRFVTLTPYTRLVFSGQVNSTTEMSLDGMHPSRTLQATTRYTLECHDGEHILVNFCSIRAPSHTGSGSWTDDLSFSYVIENNSAEALNLTINHSAYLNTALLVVDLPPPLPVPEPSTLAMVMLGLPVAACCRKRKIRQV